MRNLVSDYQPRQEINWDAFIAHHLIEARQMYAQMRSVPFTQWDAQSFETMRAIRNRIYSHKRNQL